MKRRDFLKTTGVLAGASVVGGMSVARGANASGSDLIKLALVGCGGRGRGALQQRLDVGDNFNDCRRFRVCREICRGRVFRNGRRSL